MKLFGLSITRHPFPERRTMTGGGTLRLEVPPLAFHEAEQFFLGPTKVQLPPGLYRRGDGSMHELEYLVLSTPTVGVIWKEQYIDALGCWMLQVRLDGPKGAEHFALLEVIPNFLDRLNLWHRERTRARFRAIFRPIKAEPGLMANHPFPVGLTPLEIKDFIDTKLRQEEYPADDEEDPTP